MTCLLLLAAPHQARAQGQDLVLGMSAAFSGPSRSLGLELYRGSRAYLDEVNRRGGLQGRRVVIKVRDDGFDPDRAIANTIALVERDQALALFNYTGAPTVTRTLPLLRSYAPRGLLMFFPLAGLDRPLAQPYDGLVLNLRASYQQETAALVERLLDLGYRRIGVVYQLDAYGRAGWDGLRRALATHHLTLAGEAAYRRGVGRQADMAAQVAILRQAGAQAVVALGTSGTCAAFILQARDQGWQGTICLPSYVYCERTLALLQEQGAAQGRDYTQNLLLTQVVPDYQDPDLPAAIEYRQLMERHRPGPPEDLASAGPPVSPYSFLSFEGFLNAKLMAHILERLPAGGGGRELLAAAESVRDFDLGIGQPVSLSPGRHQALERVYFFTVRQGQLEPVRDWQGWRP